MINLRVNKHKMKLLEVFKLLTIFCLIALDHVSCLQWALKSVIESQIRACYAGQMAMQFANYKHRWENNIGKNTGLDNFSGLCARAFLAALHFLIIKINEPAYNLLLKVMVLWWTNELSALSDWRIFFGFIMIFPPCDDGDNDNVFWGSDNYKPPAWPCSPARPRLLDSNVWTIFSPDFPNALHTRNILVVRASSSSSKLFIKVSLQTVIWVCRVLDMGDIQNIGHEKHQVRVLGSGFGIRLETNYYSWLELLFLLQNSA